MVGDHRRPPLCLPDVRQRSDPGHHRTGARPSGRTQRAGDVLRDRPQAGDAARATLGTTIVDSGHQLGGHTWTHSVQFGLAADAVVDGELSRTRTAVDAVGGSGLLFRPYGAGGVIDGRLMSPFGAALLHSLGYTCVLWNVLPGDWRDQDGWVDAALSQIDQHPCSVVVLHDV